MKNDGFNENYALLMENKDVNGEIKSVVVGLEYKGKKYYLDKTKDKEQEQKRIIEEIEKENPEFKDFIIKNREEKPSLRHIDDKNIYYIKDGKDNLKGIEYLGRTYYANEKIENEEERRDALFKEVKEKNKEFEKLHIDAVKNNTIKEKKERTSLLEKIKNFKRYKTTIVRTALATGTIILVMTGLTHFVKRSGKSDEGSSTKIVYEDESYDNLNDSSLGGITFDDSSSIDSSIENSEEESKEDESSIEGNKEESSIIENNENSKEENENDSFVNQEVSKEESSEEQAPPIPSNPVEESKEESKIEDRYNFTNMSDQEIANFAYGQGLSIENQVYSDIANNKANQEAGKTVQMETVDDYMRNFDNITNEFGRIRPEKTGVFKDNLRKGVEQARLNAIKRFDDEQEKLKEQENNSSQEENSNVGKEESSPNINEENPNIEESSEVKSEEEQQAKEQEYWNKGYNKVMSDTYYRTSIRQQIELNGQADVSIYLEEFKVYLNSVEVEYQDAYINGVKNALNNIYQEELVAHEMANSKENTIQVASNQEMISPVVDGLQEDSSFSEDFSSEMSR